MASTSRGTVALPAAPADGGDGRQLSVDYVVVAYRSERDLGSCLDAIEADRPAGARVLVVDNASPDRSAEVARHHASDPQVLVSSENLGFGGGCNLAMNASSANLLFFVNPDARLTQGTTARLIAAMEADPEVAAIGPRIFDPGSVLRVASAGFEPSLRSILGHFLLLARVPGIRRLFPPLQLATRTLGQRVDWVGGAALMVRGDAFRRVGGFDTAMFLYMEDVDLCRRLRELGWTIWYEPAAAVEHDLGGSQGAEQPERWFAAFHSYVARWNGTRYARAASGLAAAGLGLRAALLMPRHPDHGRRLARAARTAMALALGADPASGASTQR
jgi:N-acetylglucosaminyl-diphospho-decaprenol L-rhamnosyltransferase